MSAIDPTWLLLQLNDSAFPIGAFAHSAGLEAAWQLGDIASGEQLAAFLRAAMMQASTTAAPVVSAACREPARFDELNAFCDAVLTNAVANAASRTQGQALLATATRVFKTETLQQHDRLLRQGSNPCHLAPAFGAIYAAMGLTPEQAVGAFLFGALRGQISAAVRLGIVGPLEGQTIQYELSLDSPKWIAACMAIRDVEDACQSSPVMDFYQSLQNRLYSRLFVS